MLGKLFKYEMGAASRIFLPIYVALIILSIVNRIFRGINRLFMSRISGIIEVTLFVALGAATLLLIIQRFNKNLLKDEGYLMFTLPVKSHTLIISKLLSAIVWSIGSGIIATLAIMILACTGQDVTNIFKALPEILQQIFKSSRNTTVCIQMLLASILSYIQFILSIYFSLSVAQMPRLIKHRGKVSFCTFIIVSAVASILFGYSMEGYSKLQVNEIVIGTFCVIEVAVIVAVLFALTNYILSKHLNLE